MGSYLGVKINRALKEKSHSTVLKRIATLEAELVEDICNQDTVEDNLCIHDSVKGGVLHNRLDRKAYCSSEKASLCSSKDLEKEVGYTRALFNSAKDSLPFSLLGYESPLRRKKVRRRGESDRLMACDLIGLTQDGKLCCMEVKTNSENESTGLPYALLEGFSYAVTLKWIQENRPVELMQETEACCDFYGIKTPLPDIHGVSFCIVAPVSYFAESKRHSNIVEELETVLKDNYPNLFSGYFALVDVDSNMVEIGPGPPPKADFVRPVFRRSINARHGCSFSELQC